MVYNEQLVWKAVETILPKIGEARRNGVDFNLPSMLRTAAVEAFMTYNRLLAHDMIWHDACHIIRQQLTELETVGWMTFGTVNQYGELHV